MNKGNRNKLKTLPSQAIHPNQQFLFQSQSDDSHIKTINVASPTFATNDLDQGKVQNQSNKNIPKENKITLSLKQLRIDDNSGIRASKQKQNCHDENKKSDIVFLKEQNEKLVQKCRNLTQINKQLQKQNGILNEKLKQCKKCVQQKFNHVSKFLKMSNSSPTQSNIDLYLQLKNFKQSYKQLQQALEVSQSENNLLSQQKHQLQGIINAHTQKSSKKMLQKDQTGQKVKNVQRQFNQKIQQLKRKSQIKYKQLQTQIKQKQKTIKKTKDDYQKLKFLKQEIEKKRQQDMKIKQDLQNRIKQKQYLCVSSKQQLTKLQEQYNLLSNKFEVSHRSTENIQQQFNKCQDQLNKMCLKLSSSQAQNNKYKHNLQNYKLINQKYSQQLTQIRKQNQVFYQNVQTLKLQKDKLQSIIVKHTSTQDRQSRRIIQLQEKLNEVQKQADQMRSQLDQFIKSSSRNYPNISKFKDDQQGSEKQSTFRVIQNEKTVFYEEQIKNMEQKFNRIVQGLNKQIQQLRKCKEHLENNIQSQREKYQKINLELQNTYRKIQEFGYTQELQREGMRGEFKEKDRYTKKDLYGISQILPMEFTRATKVTPQLKMIRQILHMIIGSRESEKFNSKPLKCFREKQRQSPKSIQYLIEQIKKLAEETADLFDDRAKQLQSLVGRIVNKQEVITKLLRFTPQQKKLYILQYLKVMQNIEEYSTQQVFKVTKRLEQEASQWKDTIVNLIEVVQKNQQQISEMRKELAKYKNEQMARKYDSFGGTGMMGGIMGARQKQERQKFERDRYQEKYIYRRY